MRSGRKIVLAALLTGALALAAAAGAPGLSARAGAAGAPAAAGAGAGPAPSIAELRTAFLAGEKSCRGIVGEALARIEAAEVPGSGGLNAVLETSPRALEVADRRDAARAAGRPLGPLACVPVLVKDNMTTADGTQTTVGSLTMRGFRARRDAAVVAKLRRAGAVVVGKTNMDEWAHGASGYSSRGGQTRNGRNPLRNPGGSSGGSAAAVAAGLVPLATGSDTGGSIQIPAAFNGVVGLRATLGLVSRAGIVPYTSLTDVPGPLAGSVTDVAIALGTLTGVDRRDPATRASRGHQRRDYTRFLDPAGLEGARIGVVRRAFKASFAPRSQEVATAFAQTLDALRAGGATVVEGLPELRSKRTGWPAFLRALRGRFRVELDRWLRGPGREAPVDDLAEVVRRSARPKIRPRVRIYETLVDELESPSPRGPAYRRALRRTRWMRSVTRAYMHKHDLDALVYPAVGCAAPPLPGIADEEYRCRGAELPLGFGEDPGATLAPLLSPVTGLPVLTIPGPELAGGLRAGISLLGEPWSEGRLLRFGYALERALANPG